LVVVPVFNALAQFDACVASLDRTLPAGSRVLVADDASSDPQLEPMARGWSQRSKLDVRYVRRERRLGLAANCSVAIDAADPEDIVLLHSDALTTSGWLQRLAECAARDARIATIGSWSNHADLCSISRVGERTALPDSAELVAEAAATAAWPECPRLPAAAGPCLYLRRAALRQLGGLDVDTFAGARVFDDFCQRAQAMGWSNVLCPAALVLRQGEESPLLMAGSGIPLHATLAETWTDGEELERLVARWPEYPEQVANFIQADSLGPLRQRLADRIGELARSGPQRDMFN